MKKTIFLLVIAALAIGAVSAQNRGNWQNQNNRQSNFNSVTIEGTLKLERGIIAVAKDDTTYFVPVLSRYIGFIEGLKEGNIAVIEGYEYRNVIYPSKVTIDNKSYDFPSLAQARPDFPGSRDNRMNNNNGRNQPDFRPNHNRNQHHRNWHNYPPHQRGRHDRNSRRCCDWV